MLNMAKEGLWGFGCLMRKKRVDSARTRCQGQQLAKRLSAVDLVAIGKIYFSAIFILFLFPL